MEQLLHVMPPRACHWVVCSKPASLKGLPICGRISWLRKGATSRKWKEGESRELRAGVLVAQAPTPEGLKHQGEPALLSLRLTLCCQAQDSNSPGLTREPPQLSKAAVLPKGAPGTGLCFKCGQWGYFRKECLLMECD